MTPPYASGDVPCAGGGPDQHPLKPGKWQEKVGLAFVLDHWALIIQGRGKRLKLESLKETGPKLLVCEVGETDSQAGLRRRLVSCSWVESAVGSEEQFKPGRVPCEGRRASTEPWFGLV